MKTIKLSNGQEAIVDDEDFEFLAGYRWFLTTKGYAARSDYRDGKKTTTRMHREIMDAKGGQTIDHVNGNRLDNRKSNLRFCTQSQNMANMKMKRTNRLGLKGVHIQDGRIVSMITINRKVHYLGTFSTPEEAHEAYKAKAKELFGEYARSE